MALTRVTRSQKELARPITDICDEVGRDRHPSQNEGREGLS